MRKGDFFTVLKKDLPEDKYKARLLRELEDHWEDCQPHKSSANIEECLGDPSEFIHFYNLIMKKSISLYLEALFVGICSIPLSFLASISSALIAGPLPEQDQWQRFLPLLLTLPFLALIFHLFYGWVWEYLKKTFPEQNTKAKGLLLCLLAPTWLYIGTLVIMMFLEDIDRNGVLPLMVGIYLTIQSLAAWSIQKKNEKIGEAFQWMMLLCLIGLFMVVLAYWQSTPSDLLQVPFSWVYTITMLPFVNHFVLGQMVGGLLFALFMIYAFVGVFQGMKNKHEFRWGKVFIAFSLLYAFTFQGGDQDSAQISWARPTVELSRIWEKDQLGLLTPWYDFTSGSGNFAFSYTMKWTAEGLQLTEQEDKKILFTKLSEDPSELSWTISQDPGAFMSSFSDREEFLPSEFHCTSDIKLESAPSLGGDTFCRQLYFEDQIIFNSPISVFFDNVLVSPDKEWLVIHFPWQSLVGGILIPDKVVLVHLTGDVYFDSNMFNR